MKKKILLAVVLAISVFVVKSQTKKSKELTKEIINLSDTSFMLKEVNNKGVIVIEGTLSSSNPEIKEGEFKFYSETGYLESKGKYINNIPTGIWIYYNSNGDTTAKYNYSKAINYLMNEKTDSLEEIFYAVEQMPKFNSGSINDFRKYVAQNVKYPVYALKKGIQGRVFIKFIVDKNGKIKNISVVKGTESMDINMEAIRVISESPVWEPGMQRNTKVNVSYTVPITFYLN